MVNQKLGFITVAICFGYITTLTGLCWQLRGLSTVNHKLCELMLMTCGVTLAKKLYDYVSGLMLPDFDLACQATSENTVKPLLQAHNWQLHTAVRAEHDCAKTDIFFTCIYVADSDSKQRNLDLTIQIASQVIQNCL